MIPVGMRLAGSLATSALAIVLLAPLFLATGFILAVESVATGRIFGAIVLIDRLLPTAPESGGLVLVATALGCLGLLMVACLRFPLVLILLGGFAEVYFLGWHGNADPAIAMLGAMGLAVSCFQLWRVARLGARLIARRENL